jgi:ADP-heptose:LPS heptosyltransferase
MLHPSPLTVNKIGVIVGLDLIGDALIKLPFLRALRAAWPQAQIHWITAQGPTAYNGPLREVTQHLIDAIHEQPAWLVTPNSAPRFDLLIDTRNRWRQARQVRRDVPHGLFIAPAFRFLFSDRRPSLFLPRPPHMVDRLLQLIQLSAGYVPLSTGRLPVPKTLLRKARQIMPEGPVYIGLAPGAGNMAKAWPRENFEKLASLQAAKGRTPVFLLGPQEQDWVASLKTAVPEAIFPLQARDVWGSDAITVDETLAIGCLLDVAVANDSGTGHMLAAVDCPLISLFGPTSPAKLSPRVTHGVVIRAQDFGAESTSAIPTESVDKAIDHAVLL